MAATAAHSTVVKATGTSTSMTDEATTNTSGKTYQVTNSAKRVIDPTVAITVKDDAVAVDAADIESVDFLFGTVTFVGGYTVNGAVTITGNYLPLHTLSYAREFEITDSNMLPDATVFTDTVVKRKQTLQALAVRLGLLERVGTVFDGGSKSLASFITSGGLMVLEVNIGGSGTIFRAMVIGESTSAGAQVAGLLDESVSLQGLTASGALGDHHAYWGFGSA